MAATCRVWPWTVTYQKFLLCTSSQGQDLYSHQKLNMYTFTGYHLRVVTDAGHQSTTTRATYRQLYCTVTEARGVWTICLRLLPDSGTAAGVEPATVESQARRPNGASRPHTKQKVVNHSASRWQWRSLFVRYLCQVFAAMMWGRHRDFSTTYFVGQ